MATATVPTPLPATPVTPAAKSKSWGFDVVSKALLFVVSPQGKGSDSSAAPDSEPKPVSSEKEQGVETAQEEANAADDKDAVAAPPKTEGVEAVLKDIQAAQKVHAQTAKQDTLETAKEVVVEDVAAVTKQESTAEPAPEATASPSAPVFRGGEEIWGARPATPSPKAQRRVSFSPSVEEEDNQRQQQEAEDRRIMREALAAEAPVPFPRSSDADEEDDTDDEVTQRRGPPIVEPRKSSLEWVRQQALGKKSTATGAAKPSKSSSTTTIPPRARVRSISFSKRGIQVSDVRPNITFPGFGKNKVTKANAIASRHAKVLERMINVDTNAAAAAAAAADGSDSQSPPAQGKGGKNKGKQNHTHTHAHGPHSAHHHVSAKQVRQLKKALMDVKLANGIIAELRTMDVAQADNIMVLGGEESQDSTATGSSSSSTNSNEGTRSPAQNALRRVSLGDEERVATEESLQESSFSKSNCKAPLKAVCLAFPETEAMERHIHQNSSPSLEGENSNDEPPTTTMMPFKIPKVPTVMGISAINLITSPKGSLASAGLDAVGIFTALGNASGAAIKASGTDSSLQPPLDRIAIFTFWWGFEITLPKPSMAYLSTAHSVSGAFLNFISTMVISGGVPELLPIVKYLSMAFDLEFKAIQSADKGNGVVLAATWVMPLALVPRPWDYGLDSGVKSGANVVSPRALEDAPTPLKRQSLPTPPTDKFPQDLPRDNPPASSGGTPMQSTPRGSVALERLDEEE